MKRIIPFFQSLSLLRRPLTWLQIFLISGLLAAGYALWPSVQCALGDCGVKDKWCASDCSKQCSVAGFGLIPENTYGGRPPCRRVGSSCVQNFVPDVIGGNCNNAANCNVSELNPGTFNGENVYGRLYYAGSVRYFNVGTCNSSCSFVKAANAKEATCCVGAPVCVPSFAPPSVNIANAVIAPGHPLVFSQDPDQLGVTVTTISATGGSDTSCDSGQQNITAITVSIRLSDDTIAWINGPLALRYPGAQIKGSYPIQPTLTTTGLNTTTATTSFHFDPLDPGTYNITITATQGDGQSSSAVLAVPAFLLDSTITMPGQ